MGSLVKLSDDIISNLPTMTADKIAEINERM